MLPYHERACILPDKKEGVCELCLRNISMIDSVVYESYVESVTFREVKNFKTKETKFKCSEFLDVIS